MNWRLVGFVLGSLCLISVAAMLPSFGIAFAESTSEVRWRMVTVFGLVIFMTLLVGVGLRYLNRSSRDDRITPSDGFAVAVLGWVLMGLIGALPYYFSKNGVPGLADGIGTSPGMSLGFIDAFFESMSGLTTTGSSIFGTRLAEGGFGLIESMPYSLLFWRSMTHWLGGMGIIVLVLTVLPALRAGGYQLFQAEVPGPTAERIMPRIRRTAAILWGVYVLLTLTEIVFFLFGGMSVLDSFCHAFGTMATGGFSTKDASIGHYGSLYFEIVIMVFMFLAGINFLLHYMALRGRPLGYFKNTEFKQYVLLLGCAILVLTLITSATTYKDDGGLGAGLRYSVFQTLALTTTTGYTTTDFNLWPSACLLILVTLMFCGGCAGSTGGGLKQVRIMVVLKYIYRELMKLLRPNLIKRIKIGRTTLEERTVTNIIGLVLLWLTIFVVGSVVLLVILYVAGHEEIGLDTGFSAIAATLNNIGPGLGEVGSTRNYGWMPGLAKLLLIFCMLMGRLEVYAVIVVLLPLAWRK